MLPSGGELLIIVFVVFLLFGGRELPKIARTVGRWTSVMKRSLNDVRREFNRISIEEELKETTRNFKDLREDPLGLRNLDPPPNRKNQPEQASSKKQDESDVKEEDSPADNPAPESTPEIQPSHGRVAQDGSDQENLDFEGPHSAEDNKQDS